MTIKMLKKIIVISFVWLRIVVTYFERRRRNHQYLETKCSERKMDKTFMYHTN